MRACSSLAVNVTWKREIERRERERERERGRARGVIDDTIIHFGEQTASAEAAAFFIHGQAFVEQNIPLQQPDIATFTYDVS